jgi:hypothetical protein
MRVSPLRPDEPGTPVEMTNFLDLKLLSKLKKFVLSTGRFVRCGGRIWSGETCMCLFSLNPMQYPERE